ncbi:UvrD-helicase domain-containing protein [Janthinobacterium lividum]|uniref:AAA family ATPase n=1 Tax=Janthinobacterium lividum TaxID=29581 RepID=A0ABU0XVE7_9BURK|nr:UvrD-helicase domain-containing protein [Janthinobacterium lividum]MDQ4626216.1 AAA family ATPase [Janthinobacterium lividum]MDQ4674817.1 AAA family ATPase [Janthinobacterium lividum]MDQ4685549.1 AAA family ATPase [Janthinobacterium lividum]
MTRRVGQPDTQADLDLRACLDERPQRSFVMVAGAGSGKTTSLVKALDHLGRTRRKELKTHSQRIACITYTEVAVKEIWGDVGNDPLFHVSTIHSFLWAVVRPFQNDLKTWVISRIHEKIADAQEHHDKPKTRVATREALVRDIARYRNHLEAVESRTHFRYGAGSDFGRGILGHTDVISAAVKLIDQSQLLRDIIASRYPVLFIDESQDTRPDIVAAFRGIAETTPVGFCLGFFGDPMQKIYTDGVGAIDAPDHWRQITKPENFRCPQRVLSVVNAVRQPSDGLVQTRGRIQTVNGVQLPMEGSARIFLLLADEHRSVKLAKVREWLRRANNDEHWVSENRAADVRALVVVHRMAATRLGFPNLYAALNDKAPSSIKEGLKDGTTWPLRPFLTYLLPLAKAVMAHRGFEVMNLLRAECPRLSSAGLVGENAPDVLRMLQTATEEIARLMVSTDVAFREVLVFAQNAGLLYLDEAWSKYFDDDPAILAVDDDPEVPAVTAFLNCRVRELTAYHHYLEDLSPFATQQGVKGAEFERVLVLIDDEEGQTQRQFSYGKYFGITALSDTDNDNIAVGVDNVVDRTRRLFYVCCSRATRDLAVVMFIHNIALARASVEEANLFAPEDIVDEVSLEAALALD